MDQAVPTMLYRFFDAADQLIYVGISSVGPARWMEHAKYRSWWEQVVRSTVERYDSRAEALAAEAATIQAEQPLYNVRHVSAPRAPRARISTNRPYGGGTVIYLPERDRWAVVVRRSEDGKSRQRKVTVKDQAEGEAVLEILRLARKHPAALTAAVDLLETWFG